MKKRSQVTNLKSTVNSTFTQTNLLHSRSKNVGKEGDSSIFNIPSYILPARQQCPKFSGRMYNKFELKDFLAPFYSCDSSVCSNI